MALLISAPWPIMNLQMLRWLMRRIKLCLKRLAVILMAFAVLWLGFRNRYNRHHGVSFRHKLQNTKMSYFSTDKTSSVSEKWTRVNQVVGNRTDTLRRQRVNAALSTPTSGTAIPLDKYTLNLSHGVKMPMLAGHDTVFCNTELDSSTGVSSIRTVQSYWRYKTPEALAKSFNCPIELNAEDKKHLDAIVDSSMSTKKKRGKSIGLILDLTHWGNYPWFFGDLRDKLLEMEQSLAGTAAYMTKDAIQRMKWCPFPVREWAVLYCRHYAPTLCAESGYTSTKGYLPCRIFVKKILGRGVGGKLHIGQYRISRDLNDIEHAVAVIFGGFGFRPFAADMESKKLSADFWADWLQPQVRHRRRQVWAMSAAGESATYYPHLEDKMFLRNWDYTWGDDRRFFMQHTPAYVPYSVLFGRRTQPTPFNRKRMAVWLCSHCGAGNKRDQYIRELSKYISIDSLGDCVPMWDSKKITPSERQQHLNPETQGRMAVNWASQKRRLIANYKFVLAFENSYCFDYVTEKLMDPWAVGAIPVYMGAPNIEDYLPTTDAIINVRNFKSPKHLADHLKKLAGDEKRYRQQLAWRTWSKHQLKQTHFYREYLYAHNANERAWQNVIRRVTYINAACADKKP